MYSYHVWHHCWGYKICGAYEFCHCVQHVLMSGLIMHDQRNANTSCCWCRRRLFPSAPSKPIVCTRIDRRVTCEQTGNFVRVWTGGIIPTSKAQKRNKTPRQRSCPSLLHLINFGPPVFGSWRRKVMHACAAPLRTRFSVPALFFWNSRVSSIKLMRYYL